MWFSLIASLLGVLIFMVLALCALYLSVRIMLTAERSSGWADFWRRFRHMDWESFLPTRWEPVPDHAEVSGILELALVVDDRESAERAHAMVGEQMDALSERGYVVARQAS